MLIHLFILSLIRYSLDEVTDLADRVQLLKIGNWTDSQNQYDLHLFQNPPCYFSRISNSSSSPAAAPSLSEWKSLWTAWDFVTTTMIQDHSEIPIALRHPFIFYLGHIPAFLDIQLSKILGGLTEPKEYAEIFERGIDPDMDDPSICHVCNILFLHPFFFPFIPSLFNPISSKYHLAFYFISLIQKYLLHGQVFKIFSLFEIEFVQD